MKILAQSLVPSNPVPYLHLGYISAYALEQTNLSPVATALTIIGILITIAGTMLLATIRKMTVLRRGIGSAIVIIGIAILLISVTPVGPNRYIRPEKASADYTAKLYRRIARETETGKTIPTDIHEVQKLFQFEDRKIRDGWHRELRVEKVVTENKKVAYKVISAGRDGRFDTDDDIVANEKKPLGAMVRDMSEP